MSKAKILYLNGERVSRHKAEFLLLDGVRTPIDEALAPLIRGMYNLGVRTSSSCQGSCQGWCGMPHKKGGTSPHTFPDGRIGVCQKYISPRRCKQTVFLGFPTMADANKFLNLVYRHDDPARLCKKIRGEMFFDRGGWAWKPRLDGQSVPREKRTLIKGWWVPTPKRFQLTFGMVCLFPRAHLAMATERVKEAVRRKT